MKVKDLLKQLEGYNPNMDIDFIISDNNDNHEAKDIYFNETCIDDMELLEIDLQLHDGFMIDTINKK